MYESSDEDFNSRRVVLQEHGFVKFSGSSVLLMEVSLCLFGMKQFAPLDIPSSMDAFLQFWRPNAVMLMESELWPNLIMGAARYGVSLFSCNNL